MTVIMVLGFAGHPSTGQASSITTVAQVRVRFLFTADLKTGSLKFLARRPKVKPEVLNMPGP